jgi:hypothetical protein
MDTKTNIVTENPIYKAALATMKSNIKSDTEDAKNGPFATYSDDRRCRLLAYTFLRGKTYRQVEVNPFYLRPGFYGYKESLNYEKKRLATKIAQYIPKDLGDGTTDKDTFSHVTMWLDVGHVTRDQIIANRAGIEATRDALTAVGVAHAAIQEWNVKVDRITRDRDYAMSKDAPDAARIARYTADRSYAVTKGFEAVKTWVAAKAALEALQGTEVAV